MKWLKDSEENVILTMVPGDKIKECIEKTALEAGLVSASVAGIGAVENPVVGTADLLSGGYITKEFKGIWELININGNVTVIDGKPMAHLHVAIANPECEVRGGHLFEAAIGVTAEIVLTKLNTELKRSPSQRFPNIKVWDI
ncbi:DUF296 domain-containing protein [bacterium]|nr:DUF296 domain-containing protein [bacterium]